MTYVYELKYEVEVGVALRRPPRVDEYRKYIVSASGRTQALSVALQMASCTSVMPVWAGPVRLHDPWWDQVTEKDSP